MSTDFLPDQPAVWKPRIGVTIGDPSGIGPEITLKALADEEVRAAAQLVVIGDANLLRRTAKQFHCAFDVDIWPFDELVAAFAESAVPLEPERPILCTLDNLPQPVGKGEISPLYGKAAGEYVEAAVKLYQAGIIEGLATSPINKRSLLLGGYSFTGHTELLAHLTGVHTFALGFVSASLRVVLLTTHLPLSRALTYITKDRIERMLFLTHRELRRWGIRRPRIALAAVNPHGAEGGLFGLEEASEMIPAIEACRRVDPDMDITGPVPAESVFLRAVNGEFDVVLCCYHDQGMIPIKCLSFGEAVNVTLGLPFVRTSTNHGTAFDIAGLGVAEPQSLIAAIKLAAELVRQGQDQAGELVEI